MSVRVESELAQLRRSGAPVTVEDVVYPYVPDEQNGVKVQLRATKLLVQGVESPRSSPIEYREYPPYPPEWMKLAAASEQAHAPAFAMLRKARSMRGAQFRRSLTSPLVRVLLPYLNDVRWLANTVSDGATYAHLNGDDVEALERLIDVLHLARSLRHDEPVVSQLVACGIESLGCCHALTIAPGLRMGPNDPGAVAVRAKTRELIDRLLDEEIAWAGVRRAVDFERLIWIDDCRDRANEAWAIRPAAEHAILRLLPALELTATAAAHRTAPQARSALARRRLDEGVMPMSAWFGGPQPPRVPRYSRWFQSSDGDVAGFIERHFRMIGERRAVAVSLAWHLYRAERGRWPERLEELVPEYLLRLPTDPFHDDGRPIGYVVVRGGLPGGGDRPMVYFDAGPEEEVIDPEPLVSWYLPWNKVKGVEAVRQYRDLTLFTPPPEPANESDAGPGSANAAVEALREFERAIGLEEAVDDDPDEPDAPGKDEEVKDDVP